MTKPELRMIQYGRCSSCGLTAFLWARSHGRGYGGAFDVLDKRRRKATQMDKQPTPTGDDGVQMTRTALPDGRVVYEMTVSPESEAAIQAGCAFESATPGYLITSSIKIRLVTVAAAKAKARAELEGDEGDTKH